jgi:hypothetical protein
MHFKGRDTAVCTQNLSQRLYTFQPSPDYDQGHPLSGSCEFFQSLSDSRAVVYRLEWKSEIPDSWQTIGIIHPAYRDDTGIKIEILARCGSDGPALGIYS